MTDAIQLTLIGVAGAVVASLLRLPAALLIGPMLMVAMAKLVRPRMRKAPRAYTEVGKVLLGTFIGATFNRQALAQLGDLLLPALAAMLAMIALGLMFAWLLARLTHLDLGTALFSLTPGGMPEMVALSNHSSVPCSQSARVVWVQVWITEALRALISLRSGSASSVFSSAISDPALAGVEWPSANKARPTKASGKVSATIPMNHVLLCISVCSFRLSRGT